MHSEEQLIAGCTKGERGMQRALYERYAGAMLVVCMRYCKNKDDAEDILQEAFIKVFKSIQSFKGDSTLGYWVKRVVINTALNYQRGKLYLFPMVDINEIDPKQTQDLTLSNYQMEELLKMIQSLPIGCQVIFNMYAIEGYKHREIAKMLDISEGTSKSQYARARLLLQQMMADADKINYEKYQ
ncbi:MAG: RNA polymerase sigma factor [Cyclobacteriaceae bacterium]|nr:RNA polymerase sigma factor [Cyclobacteriaceae bacterium]